MSSGCDTKETKCCVGEISGQCYCGDFVFTVAEKVEAVSICHCNMCRHHSGADYTTWVSIQMEKFHSNRCLKDLKKFAVSEKSEAYFCKHCNTKVLSIDTKYPSLYGIPRGIFRGGVLVKSADHFFWDHRACWFDGSVMGQKHGGETGFEKVRELS